MEEDEYKSAYRELTEHRCVFEKTLTSQQGRCSFSRHFWLADREGYACKSAEAAATCSELLAKLRENARFFIKVQSVGERIPHNMAIRIQVGGLQGLLGLYEKDQALSESDVRKLVEQALADYESLEKLPYSDIMKSIASYKGRQRRKELKR